VRPSGLHSPILWLWLFLCPAVVAAQDTGLPPELHPWARFKPGAWKQFRTVTETYDERGTLTNTSTTYTTTTLKPPENRRTVALLVEAMVEMAGRQLDAQPTIVKQGLHGEAIGEPMTVKSLPPEEIVIEGQRIPCKVELVDTTGSTGKTSTKTWYSAEVAPYVLKRVTTTTDSEGKKVNETTLSVLALRDACERVSNGGIAARVAVVSTHPRGKTVTHALTSIDVPGGVICHTSDEFDLSGRLLRRSSLSLVDYGFTPKKEHSGLFNRVRSRGHKAHRYAAPPK
jgi:hypothetical protein